MGADSQEKIQQRAYEIWEREGRPEGEHERHWQQAVDELDREEIGSDQAAKNTHVPDAGRNPVPTARATNREKRRVAKGDVLAEEALAIKTGISGDEAERLIDQAGGDLESAEQAARTEAAGNK